MFKKLFCKHEYKFINIFYTINREGWYGDKTIIFYKVFKCKKCGKFYTIKHENCLFGLIYETVEMLNKKGYKRTSECNLPIKFK